MYWGGLYVCKNTFFVFNLVAKQNHFHILIHNALKADYQSCKEKMSIVESPSKRENGE